MCYIGHLNRDSSVAKQATENIRVWKLMCKEGDDFTAPFRPNYTYPKTRFQKCEHLGIEFKENSDVMYISEGLHALISWPYISFLEYVVITECYIPKGSIYFTDGVDCVSQNLIFDKSYDAVEYSKYYSKSRFKRFFMKKPKPIYIWNI